MKINSSWIDMHIIVGLYIRKYPGGDLSP